MKIMIVDDAAMMRTVLRRIFENAGFNEIIEAPDGLQAVRLYRHEMPDLVMMDLTMPEMGGLESIRQIMQINSKAMIIVCTALGQKEVVLDAIKNGAKHFLVKPFDPGTVLEKVKLVMNLSTSQSAQ